MLIHDITPKVKRAASEGVSTDTVRQIHKATNLKTLTSQRPQFRQYKSFDILPSKPIGRKRPPSPRVPGNAKGSVKKITNDSNSELEGATLLQSYASFAQYPLYVLLIALAALNYNFGQALILIYVVGVLFIRIGSRYTLITIGILILGALAANAAGYSRISENYGIYAYELFVVAILQAIISTWLENKSPKAV